MCEFISKVGSEIEAQSSNKEGIYSALITVNKEVFSHTLLYFDGFTNLFN